VHEEGGGGGGGGGLGGGGGGGGGVGGRGVGGGGGGGWAWGTGMEGRVRGILHPHQKRAGRRWKRYRGLGSGTRNIYAAYITQSCRGEDSFRGGPSLGPLGAGWAVATEQNHYGAFLRSAMEQRVGEKRKLPRDLKEHGPSVPVRGVWVFTDGTYCVEPFRYTTVGSQGEDDNAGGVPYCVRPKENRIGRRHELLGSK